MRERIAAAAARAGRDAAGVELVVAGKYVALEDLGVLAQAGVTTIGENRAQDLQAKVDAYGDTFTWDFIGHLQSRKVKVVAPLVRLIHSVGTESALEQLGRHAPAGLGVLVEVNVAGEEGKSGVAPADLARLPRRLSDRRRGPDDDAPACHGPRGQPALVRRAARARRDPRSARAVDGDDPGLRGRRRGGGDARPPRHDALPWNLQEKRRRGLTFPPTMAFSDSWHRALVYFGLAEERAYVDEYAEEREQHEARERQRARERPAAPPEPEAEMEDMYRERPNVRRLAPRRPRRDDFDDIFPDDEPRSARRPTTVLRPVDRAPARNGDVRVHLVIPKSFNDAQQVADKFKQAIPVVLNLQGTDTELAKRLIDFASGLTYALDGGMQRIASKVFMLTPRNVQISAEEKAELIEKGFFNQS